MTEHPAFNGLDLVRTIVDREFPGEVLSTSLFDYIDTQRGFLIRSGQSTTIVFTDITQARSGPWTIMVGGGIALDIPDIPGPLRWANMRNSQIVTGRYYCAPVTSLGISALVYAEVLHSYYFSLLPETLSIVNWIANLSRGVVEAAANESDQILSTFGGRPFGPEEPDVTTLFTIVGS